MRQNEAKTKLQTALNDFIKRYKNPLQGAKAAQEIMRPFGSFRISGIAPKDYAALTAALERNQ